MRRTYADQRQTLLVDCDDTLWENNVYFERAVDEFLDFLNHSALTTAEVRAVLDEIELANIKIHGYGAAGFSRNLRECYERLAERHIDDADLALVMGFGERILRQEIELIDGVEETLRELATRHTLVLFTKGHLEEQRLKIDRSGLACYVSGAIITAEKDATAYHRLIAKLGVEPVRTWMIGNSPKSDINPALAAGLNAVYIPHHHTWRLERQDLDVGLDRLLILDRFAELVKHF